MDDAKWERWSALGGILFVILVLVGAFLPGTPPKTGDSVTKIATFVHDNDDKLRWAGYLGALAFVPFAWWLGGIWRMVRRAEGGVPRLAVVATAGGVFAGVFGALGGVLLGAVAIGSLSGLSPSETRFFYIMATNLGAVALFGIAIFIGGVSGAVIRTAVLPRALGWFGGLVALVAVLGAGTVASTRDVFFALGVAGFLGAALWVLIASVLMLRAPQPAVASAA